jgi:hypothetical protein
MSWVTQYSYEQGTNKLEISRSDSFRITSDCIVDDVGGFLGLLLLHAQRIIMHIVAAIVS